MIIWNKNWVTVRDKRPQINVKFNWHTFSKQELLCNWSKRSRSRSKGQGHSHTIFGDPNWRSAGEKILIIFTFWLFFRWPLTYECDLDLSATDLDFACDTSPSVEEHLCQLILKFIHERQSYSPVKAKCPTFLPLTYDCDLHCGTDLGLA